MIKVNFKDGTTLAFDLDKEEDVQQWQEWRAVGDFQERITGVGILHNKKFYAVPQPQQFNNVHIDAEIVYTEKNGVKRKTAEQLVCFADDVKFKLLVYTYSDPPPPVALRFDVVKMKKRHGWDHSQLYKEG